jgi:tRNA/rRNA methyltransferase
VALYNHLLQPASQRDRIEVVLVSPRNPLNIGAAARAMANFGFARLAVVAPYEPHWREAQAAAVGADDLLQNAKVTATLAEAVADCTLVVGTGTLARRKPEQPVALLPALAPLIQNELARGGRVALIFGPEKRGLTREDLSHCHLLVEIPTHPRQPSMNLGQAVAVCLYELASRLAPPEILENNPAGLAVTPKQSGPHPDSGPAATGGELEQLAGVVEQVMAAANDSPAALREANRRDLRLLLRRLALTGPDTRRILGLLRRILWRLQHGTGRMTG